MYIIWYLYVKFGIEKELITLTVHLMGYSKELRYITVFEIKFFALCFNDVLISVLITRFPLQNMIRVKFIVELQGR